MSHTEGTSEEAAWLDADQRTTSRAKRALEDALARRQQSATEPNLVDAAATEDALPMPEVLIALDRLGSGHFAGALSSWYAQACRQAAAELRRGAEVIARELFDAELAKVPGARLSDPQTSKDAAAAVAPSKAGSQAGRLLLQYALHDGHRAWRNATCEYADGMTSEEAADRAEGVSLRSEYAKRVSDLATLGLLEAAVTVGTSTPVTRPGRTGRERQVWQITDAGRALAVKLRDGA